jgi:hypothetical protein
LTYFHLRFILGLSSILFFTVFKPQTLEDIMPENSERKPIHESIIDFINEADRKELKSWGKVLLKTLIPKGHKKILEAWRRRRAEFSLMTERDDEGVTASLLQQEAAAKKAAEKAADDAGNDIF